MEAGDTTLEVQTVLVFIQNGASRLPSELPFSPQSACILEKYSHNTMCPMLLFLCSYSNYLETQTVISVFITLAPNYIS